MDFLKTFLFTLKSNFLSKFQKFRLFCLLHVIFSRILFLYSFFFLLTVFLYRLLRVYNTSRSFRFTGNFLILFAFCFILFFRVIHSLSNHGDWFLLLDCHFFFLIPHCLAVSVKSEFSSFTMTSPSERFWIFSSLFFVSSFFSSVSNFSLEFSSHYHVVGVGNKFILSDSLHPSLKMPMSIVW